MRESTTVREVEATYDLADSGILRMAEALIQNENLTFKKKLVGERLEPFPTGGDQGSGFLPYQGRAAPAPAQNQLFLFFRATREGAGSYASEAAM